MSIGSPRLVLASAAAHSPRPYGRLDATSRTYSSNSIECPLPAPGSSLQGPGPDAPPRPRRNPITLTSRHVPSCLVTSIKGVPVFEHQALHVLVEWPAMLSCLVPLVCPRLNYIQLASQSGVRASVCACSSSSSVLVVPSNLDLPDTNKKRSGPYDPATQPDNRAYS